MASTERVVFEFALRQQLARLVIDERTDRDAPRLAVEPDQVALLELEAVPVRLRRVFEFLRERVHAARGDLRATAASRYGSDCGRSG